MTERDPLLDEVAAGVSGVQPAPVDPLREIAALRAELLQVAQQTAHLFGGLKEEIAGLAAARPARAAEGGGASEVLRLMLEQAREDSRAAREEAREARASMLEVLTASKGGGLNLESIVGLLGMVKEHGPTIAAMFGGGQEGWQSMLGKLVDKADPVFEAYAKKVEKEGDAEVLKAQADKIEAATGLRALDGGKPAPRSRRTRTK